MAVVSVQDRAVSDYLTDELRLRHDAAEADRMGDFSWAVTCRLYAAICHKAVVVEQADPEPEGLAKKGGLEP